MRLVWLKEAIIHWLRGYTESEVHVLRGQYQKMVNNAVNDHLDGRAMLNDAIRKLESQLAEKNDKEIPILASPVSMRQTPWLRRKRELEIAAKVKHETKTSNA